MNRIIRTLLFALAGLGCLGAGEMHDNPIVKPVYPWEGVTITLRVVRQRKNAQGVVTSETPVVGAWYNMFNQDTRCSGYHSHECESSERPSQTPIAVRALAQGETPTRLKTDGLGYVIFRWLGNNFSGEVTTFMIPEDTSFPTEKFHTYLGYFDLAKHGSTVQPVYLRALPAYGDLADFTRHDDTRHKDNAGQVGNSRYGTINALASIELMAHYFRTRGPGNQKMDIPRISLRDGGCADNKMLAGAGTVYQYTTWAQLGCNSLGIAINIENPVIAAGGIDTDTGKRAFGVFEQVAENLLRCRLSKLQDDAISLVPAATSPVPAEGGGFLLVNDYWLHQPIVNLVCSAAPGPTAN